MQNAFANLREHRLQNWQDIDCGGVSTPTVELSGRRFVYNRLDPLKEWSRPGVFTPDILESLRNIDAQKAKKLLPAFSLLDRHEPPQVEATYDIAWAIDSFTESKAMRELKYQGREIAPNIVALSDKHGFAHRDMGEENILVTVSRDRVPTGTMRPVIARMIQFNTPIDPGQTVAQENARTFLKLDNIRHRLLIRP